MSFDTPGADQADRLDPALLKLAGVVLVGAATVQLDITIINVAISTLAHELDTGLSTIQWVSTGYLWLSRWSFPLTGWAVDRSEQAHVDALDHAVSRRLDAVWPAWSSGKPDRVPRGAGHRRRYDAAAASDDPRPGGRAASAGAAPASAVAVPALVAPILGPVIGGPDPQQPQLALDLLHQRARLPDRPAAGLAATCPTPRARRHPLDVIGLALLSRRWRRSSTAFPKPAPRELQRQPGGRPRGGRRGARLRPSPSTPCGPASSRSSTCACSGRGRSPRPRPA